MAKNLISGESITFKGIEIHRYVTAWSDTRKPALANHRFLKRDGGLSENMGREPHVAKVTLAFIGADQINDFKRLSASIDKDPTGSLIHPYYGQMTAACEGFEGSQNIEGALDLYTISLTFRESNVDPKAADVAQGPAAQQQQVTNYTGSLTTLITQFAASSAAIQNLTEAAAQFMIGVVSSQTTNTLDPTLTNQLADVQAKTTVCVSSLKVDPGANGAQALAYPAIALCEQIYDACSQSFASISVNRPTLFLYTNPVKQPLIIIAARFYGKDAKTRLDEIISNNPGKIPNPSAVAAGTQLILAPATVPQG